MAYTPVMIDGQPYAVRLPTGGSYHGAASEWDTMLNTLGEKNPVYHSKNILSWCQDEAVDSPGCRVYRGQLSARHWNNTYSFRAYPHVGYRPILEPLDPETLLPDPSRLGRIPDGSVLPMGTFYINGIAQVLPQEPFWCGDVPEYRNQMLLSIGDTDTNPKKQLHFIKCGRLLWCDRNLITNISWDTLNAFGLTHGGEEPPLKKDPLAKIIAESQSALQHPISQCEHLPIFRDKQL